jgi:hypothetical protein
VQHEDSISQIFNDEMRAVAIRTGLRFQPFPLDGQDRNLLSDHLLTDYSNFCLVEFKYTDKELRSEAEKKKRVEALRLALQDNDEVRAVHERCHFIAWRDSLTAQPMADVYRNQICNQETLGPACGLRQKLINRNKEIDVDIFAQQFYGQPPKRSVGQAEFQIYVSWLLSVVTEGRVPSIELLARAKNAGGKTVVIKLNSLHDLYNWLSGARPAARLKK